MKWFASIVTAADGSRLFNGRVFAADNEGAARKFAALCPTIDLARVEFLEDPQWEIRSSADIPATLQLDGIPERVRWTIANALRAAADKWGGPDGYSKTMANAEVAAQFQKQAAEAIEIAEQMENC